MSEILSKRLGDICEVINGRAYKQEELLDQGKYKVLRVGNFFTNNSWYYSNLELEDDKYCDSGDLLFAWSASFGPRIWKGDKAIYHYHIWKMIENSEILNKNYLFYYLENKTKSFMKSTHGSIMLHLTKSFIENLIIFYPEDINVQINIAQVLTNIDSKIELNNRINAELEVMAKLIYDYWFVQFDFPNEEGKPYKSSGGKMVWNEEVKRGIPEGWEVNPLSDWINNDKSGDWGKEAPEGNYSKKVYCIRGADINGLNGKGSLNTPERYILEKNLHKILDPADLIIEISGGSPTQSTGRLAFVTNETLKRFDAPIICSNFCKAVTLKDKKLLFNFVYYWNSVYDAGILFGYEGKTSGIKNLLFESFISTHLAVLPSKKIADKFYDLISPIHSKKQANLLENQKLTELRDWLLPMLMNGQVKVGGLKEELNIPEAKKGFAKQTLAGKIISEFKDDPGFTHIKFQKLQYLAEHIAEADLNWNYYFQAAGPYDNKFMHSISDHLKRAKWFEERDYKFIALEKQDKIDGYFQGYFSPVANRLEQLFTLLKDASEATSEIIATMYAVWNNRIIQQQKITEALLLEDFYNWSDRKHQYTNAEVLKGLQWLKRHNFEPKGWGKVVKRAKK